MKKLIAIGGSDNDLDDIKNIFDYMFNGLPSNSKLIYIPVANSDHEGYSQYMKSFFEDNYGARVDILYLLNKQKNYLEIRQQIMDAQCIFVEGGNLNLLLKELSNLEMKNILVDAYNKGIVLSGISAGAMCWFEYGFSDNSDRITLGKNYSVINCLGMMKGIVCPHYNVEERREKFIEALNENELLSEGWGIENGSALVLENDNFSYISNVKHFIKDNGIQYKNEVLS